MSIVKYEYCPKLHLTKQTIPSCFKSLVRLSTRNGLKSHSFINGCLLHKSESNQRVDCFVNWHFNLIYSNVTMSKHQKNETPRLYYHKDYLYSEHFIHKSLTCIPNTSKANILQLSQCGYSLILCHPE